MFLQFRIIPHEFQSLSTLDDDSTPQSFLSCNVLISSYLHFRQNGRRKIFFVLAMDLQSLKPSRF